MPKTFTTPGLAEYDTLHEVYSFGYGDKSVHPRMVELWTSFAGNPDVEWLWNAGIIGGPFSSSDLH